MSEIEFSSPEDQINYAIKLIIEAYENKSKIYENEIKQLNEEINQKDFKIEEFNKKYLQLEKEKEILEENVARILEENNYLVEIINNLTNENKKLEKFKVSILESIENNEIKTDNSKLTTLSESNKAKLNKNNTNFLSNLTFSKLNNTNKIYIPNSCSESVTDSDHKLTKVSFKRNEMKNVKYSLESSELSSIKINKELNVDNLIEKLNSSINNKAKLSNGDDEFKILQIKSSQKIPELKKKSKEKIEIQSLREDSYENENNLESSCKNNSYTDNSNQYIFSSNFFAECRMTLKKKEYAKIIEILKLCNNNKIEKEETLISIEKILSKYEKLKSDFKKIFYPNNE